MKEKKFVETFCTECGKKMVLEERTIRYWEQDKELLKNAKVKNILKLCKVLKISVGELV